MYAIHSVASDVLRLELAHPDGTSPHVARPNNVYLIRGGSCALINAGHPLQHQALLGALREADVTASQIERIVYTSWHVDHLAGAVNFPQADHFVLSPDMVEPLRYASHVRREREEMHSLAEALREHEVLSEQGFLEVEAYLERNWPRVTENLRFVPIRNGHFVTAASLELEVLGTPGPGAGHACLYEAHRRWLFTGDFALSGLPERLDETQAYLISLERLLKIEDVEALLPAYNAVQMQRGRWTLSRALRFMNNFLTGVPQALVRAPTVVEFIARDLGQLPDDPVELLLAYRRYTTLFEELVRTRAIASQGVSVERRFGTDLDDPRADVRR